MDSRNLPEITLACLDETCAIKMMDLICEQVPEGKRKVNSVRREGANIIITYFDKMWPFDIADMAGELGLAGDAESAAVIACL